MSYQPGTQTLWVPAEIIRPRTTFGCARNALETATSFTLINTCDFDPVTVEFAQFVWVPPKAWNRGTLRAKFYWSHPATTTNFAVQWFIQGRAFSNDDPLDAPGLGTATGIADTGGTTDDLYVSAITNAFTIVGSPAEEDMIVIQIQRLATDAGDTLAVDARLHGIALFYRTNAPTDE